ncbi:3-hydroxyisobutyrate dehydrogenase [Rubellimicrobium rubrum]|uniref:3-hydroxyisobutyrate dehydrogenase n=1 Tax=Rubellimicrobium rubrum TaxID=2585369 RepID=A0A5C4MUB6_9RHOB|nr:NAD(P)-binding domain-containing protein [Rubellimicrobium rubrum]TNC48543.1 3-hydroxyisobutyrate dehydrogenase [Rubellimicrobium rubrum]
MKIGIIGAGQIGGQLARTLAAAGHEVRLANSRGPESLQDTVRGTSIHAATPGEAGQDAEVIILSVPFAKMPGLSGLLAGVPQGAVVIDTSNYYPARDGHIGEVDEGTPETAWASAQVGRPLIKAWNALLAQTLANSGAESGAPGRIAIPIAGDDPAAKRIAVELVDLTGFDTVDAGPLAQSWRFQPGTPAYCTELGLEDLRAALAAADRDRAPRNRDTIMARFATATAMPPQAEIVATNRALSA